MANFTDAIFEPGQWLLLPRPDDALSGIDQQPPLLSITPSSGATLLPEDAITVEASDDRVIAIVTIYSADRVIYDGSSFTPDYAASSKTFTTGGVILSVRRTSGWWAGSVPIDAVVIDSGGNLQRVVASFNVSPPDIVLPPPAEIIPTAIASTAPLARLITQYKNKPRLRALAQSYLEEVAELATVLAQLRVAFRLGNAIGAQLDVLGTIVGAPRQGFDDDAYEQLIRAYIRAQKSEGKPEDIYAVFRILIAPGDLMVLDEYYPMAIVLRIASDAGLNLSVLTKLLFMAKGQAVRVGLVYGRKTRVFKTAPGASSVINTQVGLGDIGNPSKGGLLSGVTS
jgi:hypothetical protein